MANYTIQAVSSKPPREWSFTDKRTQQEVHMTTYNVMLNEVSDPVQINKKPGDKPKVGDELHGTIEDGEYGKKFKPERKPFGGSNYQPRDDAAIQSQWALGQATTILIAADPKKVDLEKLLELGKVMYGMIDVVKASKTKETEPANEPLPKPPEDMNEQGGFDEEPVNLDDIPFN